MTLGECNCGAVSFQISTEITDVFICHCSICRRSTGSSGIAVCVINKSDFAWIHGKDSIRVWSKSGHDWQTSFCTNCGSPLPGKNDSEHMYIPVSLLSSEKLNLKVKHHLFVASKASWDEIGDSGVQHKEGYE